MIRNKGFTLIELLVVIAIIGVLSSIVLASLNNARARGNDAKIKAQLSGVRAAMELYYNGAGNYTYGTATNNCDNIFDDTTVASYIDNTEAMTGVAVKCVSTGTGYAISANLLSISGNNDNWCVDYVGNSSPQNDVQPNGDDTCN